MMSLPKSWIGPIGFVWMLSACICSAQDYQTTIKAAHAALQKLQWTDTTAFRAFPLRWATQKGLYQSHIHMNAVGSWEEDLVRKMFAIPDTNGFVTMFVATMLLECDSLGTLTVDVDALQSALDAVASYHDGNSPADVPVMSFWPQVFDAGLWSAHPPNLFDPLTDFDSFADFLSSVLDFVGLGWLGADITRQLAGLQVLQDAFHIPPDADDSGCNVALGGWLASQKASFPALYASWESRNPDIFALLERAATYAYAPASATSSAHTQNLDPRTYYFLHSYLESGNVSTESRFVATWLMGLQQDAEDIGRVAMPFNVNNVDLAVASNFLYGVTNAVVRDLNGGAVRAQFATNDTVRALYQSTADLLGWAVDSGRAFARPDIGMLYYPSRYDFIWMVARNFRLLHEYVLQQADGSADPLLVEMEARLMAALRGAGTDQLLALAKSEATSGFVVWDDFLGDYGTSPTYDDRLFSTALAANALVDMWSVRVADPVSGKQRGRWDPDTPARVRAAFQGAVSFLNAEVMGSKYSRMNAFFSGSMKANSTNFFAYPGNYAAMLNGSVVSPHGPFPADGVELVYAMAGICPAEDYAADLTRTWWSFPVPPANQVDFNVPGNAWPFWSSEAMTFSTALLAISNLVSMEN